MNCGLRSVCREGRWLEYFSFFVFVCGDMFHVERVDDLSQFCDEQ
jgi:hypothetical protein